jgi:hypothetical protein
VVLGLVTFRRLRDGYLRSLALLVAGVALMQVFFSYGDLGLTYSRSMIFLGCMLGMLAVLPRLAEEAPPEPAETASAESRRVRRRTAAAPAGGLSG